MRNKGLITGAGQLAAITLIVVALDGCAQTEEWLSGRGNASSTDPIILGAPEADVYLEELYALAAGDPATRAEIFIDAEAAAKLTPGPSTNLRFALVLASPGHAESDPERAQSMLRELLTQTELMTPAEISLATIHLRSVEELIVRIAEARRLRETNSRAARTEEAAINQRIATVEADNRRLRRELAEAEDKLEAITSIERSIRENQ